MFASERAAKWLTGYAVALAALVAGAPHASAQSTGVEAQSLFDEGRKLLAAGKIAEACDSFEASQKLDPAVTTLLNLAQCREQNHQIATAWGAFVEANRLARATSNAKLGKVATTHAKKLEPKLSKLTIAVPDDRQVPGLEVLRGSELVATAAWNHALPIDGGSYTISARAPGYAAWSITKMIKNESDLETVEVPRLAEVKGVGPVAATSGPPGTTNTTPATPPGPANPPPRVAQSEPPSSAATTTRGQAGTSDGADTSSADQPAPAPSRSLVMPIVFGGAALALGGVAVGVELSSESLHDQALRLNAMHMPMPAQAQLNQANQRRYIAEGVGGAAILCAGAAVYFYLTGRGDHHEPTALVPAAGAQYAGLAVVGRW